MIYIMGILSFITSCFTGKTQKADASGSPASEVWGFTLEGLDGGPEIKLSDYKGKYIVIVNTASECGYTPQYKDLQDFYESYKDSNIVVIGCPCNQFGAQEPGSEAEIKSFCSKNYGVSFPMSAKLDVKGPNQHPLYKWLTTKSMNGSGDFEVKWNFSKFVINPEGKLTWFFPSGVKPGDEEFRKALGL